MGAQCIHNDVQSVWRGYTVRQVPAHRTHARARTTCFTNNTILLQSYYHRYYAPAAAVVRYYYYARPASVADSACEGVRARRTDTPIDLSVLCAQDSRTSPPSFQSIVKQQRAPRTARPMKWYRRLPRYAVRAHSHIYIRACARARTRIVYDDDCCRAPSFLLLQLQ